LGVLIQIFEFRVAGADEMQEAKAS
jgi:hypothetical protein